MNEGLLAITFDDGFRTDLTVGLQEQLNRGMEPKGTSYIISSTNSENRLTTDEKMILINNGWDLQCHTHTHPINPNLTGHTAEQLHLEMQEVNTHFNSVLNLPTPEHHAYPGGGNNKLVHDVLGRYRRTMRTTEKAFFTKDVFKKKIPSFPPRFHDPEYIVDTCLERGLCATMLYHELPEGSTDIADYRRLLDYAKERGLRLVTMTELYNEMMKR